MFMYGLVLVCLAGVSPWPRLVFLAYSTCFSAVKKRLLNEVVAVCYIAAMLDGLWELYLFLCCLGRLAICLQSCTAHLIMNALVGTNKPGAVLDGRIMRTCKVLYLFSGKLVLCKCSKPKKIQRSL